MSSCCRRSSTKSGVGLWTNKRFGGSFSLYAGTCKEIKLQAVDLELMVPCMVLTWSFSLLLDTTWLLLHFVHWNMDQQVKIRSTALTCVLHSVQPFGTLQHPGLVSSPLPDVCAYGCRSCFTLTSLACQEAECPSHRGLHTGEQYTQHVAHVT